MIGSMQLQPLLPLLGAELKGPDVMFSGVSTDSRKLVSGDLYVALRGERFDGHEFVADASRDGATAALVEYFVDCEISQLRVADSRKALGQIAILNRQRSPARRFALTGSQGKTTVKEICARIMGLHNRVLVTRGNLNNDIGVPLMLLELDRDHSLAVFELGANAAGEIAWTVELVAPEIVLINNAAETHLEGFGSLEGVVQAKGEIIDGVIGDGVVVLNADDPAVDIWTHRAGNRRVVTFSTKAGARSEYSVRVLSRNALGSRIELLTPEGECLVDLPLPGTHNIANALAATALCMEAGISLDDVCEGIQRMEAVPGRLAQREGLGGSVLLDDSYNASPSSFRAAIEVLVSLARERDAIPVLVAGDMAELGDRSAELHRQLGRDAENGGVAQLWACGRHAEDVVAGLDIEALAFPDRQALIHHARAQLSAKTVLLVKGSRSAGMQDVVTALSNGASDQC